MPGIFNVFLLLLNVFSLGRENFREFDHLEACKLDMVEHLVQDFPLAFFFTGLFDSPDPCCQPFNFIVLVLMHVDKFGNDMVGDSDLFVID